MDTGEAPKLSAADRFHQMAERIEHNSYKGTFGGAFVIIPPPQGGEPMEALILDPNADPVQFFMLLQAKVQTVLNELQAKQASPYGIRR